MIPRAAVATVLFAFAATASAQIPLGPEFRVDTGSFPDPFPYFSTSRSLARAANGDFVVAWTAGTNNFDSDVIARRFAANGVARGPEFVVNTDTAGGQYEQALAMNDGGDFVVVWTGNPGIHGQRFAASGARLGTEFQVNVDTGDAIHPSVAMAPDGGFLAAWTNRAHGPNPEVFGRRFDPAGAPVGGDFAVNAYTTGRQARPSVSVDASGNFVVVWESGPEPVATAVGRRVSSSGVPQGAEFAISNGAGGNQLRPRVGSSRAGNFVVAWLGLGAGANAVFARRFDAAGAPLAPDFRVDSQTTVGTGTPALAVDADGDFVIAWWYAGAQDGSNEGVFARRFDGAGVPAGPELQVNTYTTGRQWLPSVATDPSGNFVVSWYSDQAGEGVFAQRFAGGLNPVALVVDAAAGPLSDGNGVLEVNEEVSVAPTWRNDDTASRTFDGVLISFGGPGTGYLPPTDPQASYGTVPVGATRSCTTAADCYAIPLFTLDPRPVQHWDATLGELLVPPSLGVEKLWTIHVGGSFGDVPRANPFYRFVETLLHHSVTTGCGSAAYCPASSSTREQMAVFVLVAKEGAGYVPPACVTPVFNDVPATSPFCPWIEELARRGVVSGCGNGSYCPAAAVSREQMGVFVLATKEPGIAPAACGTPSRFSDVPATSGYCPWIEELARRNVVTGCGGGNYCPLAAVTREQMAVLISAGFGLQLYGP